MAPPLAAALLKFAEGDIGRAEEPMGSNRGKWLDEVVLDPYGSWMRGQPWCAAWIGSLHRRAGVTNWMHFASPSTALMCERARDNGWTMMPRPGAIVVWCGTHVELLVEHVNGDVWRTIGGNTSDAVRPRVRSLAGTLVYGHPTLAAESPAPRPKVQFWFRDTSPVLAKSRPFPTTGERDADIANLSKDWQKRASRWHRPEVGYGYTIGPRVIYGPFKSQKGRNAARNRVAAVYHTPVDTLIAFRSEQQGDGTRKTVPPQPAGTIPRQKGAAPRADGLGKVT